MQMQVDGRLIRSQRERRAWSQEHLATVAGLGLRTVQRIEATGLASYESIQAIAAVLEIPVFDLTIPHEAMRNPLHRHRLVLPASMGAAVMLAVVGLFAGRAVLARDVMLNVGLAVNDEDRGTSRLLTADGKDAEIRIAGVLRLLIVPTVRPDGSVLLALKIYDVDGERFVLASEPKLVTANDSEAEVRWSTGRGNTYRVVITPQIR